MPRGGVTLKRRCTHRPSVIYLIVNKLLSLFLSLSLPPPLPPLSPLSLSSLLSPLSSLSLLSLSLSLFPPPPLSLSCPRQITDSFTELRIRLVLLTSVSLVLLTSVSLVLLTSVSLVLRTTHSLKSPPPHLPSTIPAPAPPRHHPPPSLNLSFLHTKAFSVPFNHRPVCEACGLVYTGSGFSLLLPV